MRAFALRKPSWARARPARAAAAVSTSASAKSCITGGGASVVYADTICYLGYGKELANYGEYSGRPAHRTARALVVASLLPLFSTYSSSSMLSD